MKKGGTKLSGNEKNDLKGRLVGKAIKAVDGIAEKAIQKRKMVVWHGTKGSGGRKQINRNHLRVTWEESQNTPQIQRVTNIKGLKEKGPPKPYRGSRRRGSFRHTHHGDLHRRVRPCTSTTERTGGTGSKIKKKKLGVVR